MPSTARYSLAEDMPVYDYDISKIVFPGVKVATPFIRSHDEDAADCRPKFGDHGYARTVRGGSGYTMDDIILDIAQLRDQEDIYVSDPVGFGRKGL